MYFSDYNIKISNNSILVMVDNRDNSLDSRQLGVIKREVIGKNIYRFNFKNMIFNSLE